MEFTMKIHEITMKIHGKTRHCQLLPAAHLLAWNSLVSRRFSPGKSKKKAIQGERSQWINRLGLMIEWSQNSLNQLGEFPVNYSNVLTTVREKRREWGSIHHNYNKNHPSNPHSLLCTSVFWIMLKKGGFPGFHKWKYPNSWTGYEGKSQSNMDDKNRGTHIFLETPK